MPRAKDHTLYVRVESAIFLRLRRMAEAEGTDVSTVARRFIYLGLRTAPPIPRVVDREGAAAANEEPPS